MTYVLDHGYLKLVEFWGSDMRIIESARMSTAKGFLGWGPKHRKDCEKATDPGWACDCAEPGDEKLLKFLWDNAHSTPFEMAGFTVEVKAPIFVFREWHRHRVPFGYSEASARYVPLPDEDYIPTINRMMLNSKTNKQAGTLTGAPELSFDTAQEWQEDVTRLYGAIEKLYQKGLQLGVPKELARIVLPVGRYSCMRATSNLRGWLAFCQLRCAPGAQWEIRQYANEVAKLIKELFPRTYDVARDRTGTP